MTKLTTEILGSLGKHTVFVDPKMGMFQTGWYPESTVPQVLVPPLPSLMIALQVVAYVWLLYPQEGQFFMSTGTLCLSVIAMITDDSKS